MVADMQIFSVNNLQICRWRILVSRLFSGLTRLDLQMTDSGFQVLVIESSESVC